jgi:hypothetical protein
MEHPAVAVETPLCWGALKTLFSGCKGLFTGLYTEKRVSESLNLKLTETS